VPTKVSEHETRIYLGLWRKAARTGDDITITLGSYNEALAVRMGMYRAIKPYRKGQLLDEELAKAADEFTPGVIKGSCELVLRKRRGNALADLAAEQAGLEPEDLYTPEEIAAQRSAERVIGELLAEKPVENKFYTRD
jgi:hypothetical protein